MTDSEPVVELLDVTFGYPPNALESPVLENVSLAVAPRDFLGIIGPNGGGKTTLLRVMLGLLEPRRGTVRVLGKPARVARRQIGYVPQYTMIDADFPGNVLDIVLTGRLSLSSWGPRFGESHIDAALEALRLTGTADLARRRFATLSGGQRQRVLVARGLAADARMLLLDEPTAGVDLHMEESMIDLLHQLNKRLPIVMVSHDISFVSRHLKRVACLNRRLTVHTAADVSWDVISETYGDQTSVVRHREGCPLHDPGCAAGCRPASPAAQSPR